MSRRTLAALAATAALAGLLIAAVLALAIPRGHVAASAGDPGYPRTAPTRPPSESASVNGVRVHRFGAATIAARTPDPLGGPDWAVRVVRQQQLFRGPDGLLHRSSGLQRCAQLGRLLNGRFGWIDGTNVFRPVPIGFEGAPIECGSSRRDLRRDPKLDVLTRVADPDTSSPRPLQTIVWGFTGATSVAQLQINGHEQTVARSSHGVFVHPIAFTPERPAVRLTVRYPQGAPVALVSSFRGDGEHWRAQQRMIFRRIPMPPRFKLQSLPSATGHALIDHRVQDPAGGPPWGYLAVPGEHGGWCISGLGRVVDQRVGQLDPTLGTFIDAGPDPNLGCLPPSAQPTPRRPLDFIDGFTSLDDATTADGPAAADRIARRTQPGRTFVQGIANPAVRSITIETPRDVRTITPSPHAHAFAVVYDGDFPTGRIQITAQLARGRTYRTQPFNGNEP